MLRPVGATNSLMLAATASLPPGWQVGCVPFVLLLLAISLLPLIRFTRHWWESNWSKLVVSLMAGGATMLWLAMADTTAAAGAAMLHSLHEYLPFIVLLTSLYAISGGIALRCQFQPTPRVNAAIMLIGAALASVIGTTGAAMLLIRPLLQVNAKRTRVAHTVVFFTFLVANIGGLLLPVGDPPLFLGYLRGVPFFWTLAMWPQWALAAGGVLTIYLLVDSFLWRCEPEAARRGEGASQRRLHLQGSVNFLWLAGVLASVVVLVPGSKMGGVLVPEWAREVAMAGFTIASLCTTPAGVRQQHHFSWGPMLEVAALFAGIFLAMQVPLLALRLHGAELGISSPAHFFWVSGALSSVLDNAPTYLTFLETAQAVTREDATSGAVTALTGGGVVRTDLLTAISLGSVFMGAMTYIGNGPNFMVKAVAEHAGVRMPTFGGYLLWSMAVLLPVFGLITVIFLR